MRRTLELWTKDSPLADIAGAVGLLCELAPDSPCLQKAECCFQAEELLGPPDGALSIAYSLVSKLLLSAPVVEGLPLLSIFEEEMLEQFSYIAQAFHLDEWITRQKFSACRFASYSAWLDRLRNVREITGSSYELAADVPALQSSRRGRLLQKLWEARSEPSQLFRRVAPLWSRYLSGVRIRKLARAAPRGGIWFYSTAYTFTKIALEYEPYLPEKLNFLVEDSTTGGKRLRELRREWHLLHAWSRASDIPSAAQRRAVARQISSAFASVPLAEPENRMRTVFLRSDWYHNFLTRRLPFALYNSRVVRRWHQSVMPAMIVVGNAAWERALLQCQGTEGLPRIMLQHGIMHWVYSVADQPVDRFLLRGPFFQRVINDSLRRKTVICNFPAPDHAVAPHGPNTRQDIVFITMPYDVPPLFHPQELRDILRSLLRASCRARRRLVVRVHPAEKISFYKQLISELQPELGMQADVVYSQGPGAEQILARCCVAVLFFSTMFVDCLRHRIPIISFEWHWFPYKADFEKEKIFNFAADLQHFEALIKSGIEGDLPVRRFGLEEFLAPTSAAEVSRFLEEIWNARKAPEHGKGDGSRLKANAQTDSADI